jgi:hypothetical protein
MLGVSRDWRGCGPQAKTEAVGVPMSGILAQKGSGPSRSGRDRFPAHYWQSFLDIRCPLTARHRCRTSARCLQRRRPDSRLRPG